jgi:uncharacterized protein YndB with AHSA1/START domain
LLIERQVFVKAPRESVFEMFVDSARLASWLGISADLEPLPGGRFRFEIVAGEYCSGRYVEVDAPRRVTLTRGWEGDQIPVAPGSTLVEVELDELPGGTLVRLRHSRIPPPYVDLHAEGWERFLGRLAAVVEGCDPGAHPGSELPADALARLERERGTG